MKTFFSVYPKTITNEELTKAIDSLMFLKEKHNGRVKGRSFANYSKQRTYINKEDKTSPIVSA